MLKLSPHFKALCMNHPVCSRLGKLPAHTGLNMDLSSKNPLFSDHTARNMRGGSHPAPRLGDVAAVDIGEAVRDRTVSGPIDGAAAIHAHIHTATDTIIQHWAEHAWFISSLTPQKQAWYFLSTAFRDECSQNSIPHTIRNLASNVTRRHIEQDSDSNSCKNPNKSSHEGTSENVSVIDYLMLAAKAKSYRAPRHHQQQKNSCTLEAALAVGVSTLQHLITVYQCLRHLLYFHQLGFEQANPASL